MLQNKAMLVDLTIHRWTATKHDRAVSAEVERTHSAKDAGRYNKALIDKAHLAKIDTLGNEIRRYHYEHTLPWTDKGARLLPSELFMEYREGIIDLRRHRDTAVNDFLKVYPALVQDARNRLNTMFQADDYPSVDSLRTSFGVDLEIMPVPDAEDFRVQVGKEEQDEIRQQIMSTIQARQEKAVKDCWNRVHEVTKRIVDQCSNPKGRIHDSLMDNADDLVTILHGLNITQDPLLTEVEADLRALIVPVERIRQFPSTRSQVASKAVNILAKVPA